MPKLLLIDGTALVFRAFYGIRNPMINSQGLPTNAIYGFYNMLFNILTNYKPDYFVVAFDRSEPTRRHIEYTEYKANRSKAPDELYQQIPIIKSILKEGSLNLVEYPGHEADDIIATISEKNQNPNLQTYIYSADFDLLQLVNPNVSVIIPSSKEEKIITPDLFEKKYNLTPKQIPDYKGLSGDSSDNLPGVKGIGPKTATKLLNTYQTLENIYTNIEEIPSTNQQKLKESKEIALLCKKLATLNFESPISTNIQDYTTQNINLPNIKKEFEKIEFKKLISKLNFIQKVLKLENKTEQKPTNESQISLF